MTDRPKSAPRNDHLLDVFHNVVASSEAYAAACVDIQHELLKYAAAGLQWNVRTAEALGACTNLSEIAEIQNDWIDVATRDYFDAAARLTQIAARAASPAAGTPAEPSPRPSAAASEAKTAKAG